MKDIFVKKEVTRDEFMLNRITNFLGIPSPKVLGYYDNTLKLEKINGMSLSDFYGEKETDIPEYIYESIRVIIEELLKIGICYPDITGYNFMIDDKEKLWIIDFGHAYVTNPEDKLDPFVEKFINGYNGWNPDFR
jgi:tRNA A-37 threonylcarbamoyl transferase component Bud32